MNYVYILLHHIFTTIRDISEEGATWALLKSMGF